MSRFQKDLETLVFKMNDLVKDAAYADTYATSAKIKILKRGVLQMKRDLDEYQVTVDDKRKELAKK